MPCRDFIRRTVPLAAGVALVFHNSVQVWRNNTRGIYHVVNIATKKVRPVSTRAGLQMFAKFSPNGTRVAFVRDNNLFVTDLASGREDQLTRDGSSTIINGATDWVYEEELSLADAFRWSPDGRRIAFWRFDQSPIPLYPLINELSLYPTMNTLRYPKAGAATSRVRLGVITLGRGSVTWLDVGAGSDQYLARTEHAAAGRPSGERGGSLLHAALSESHALALGAQCHTAASRIVYPSHPRESLIPSVSS